MTDSYPEYLNPFAEDFKPKSKLKLSHSFKEFKRTLRQSFRIKKKEDEQVTIRQKTDTCRRVPVSYPNQQMALPRSRFRERLSKAEPSASTPAPNPFEENGRTHVNLETTRRRGKKRAPLPPKSSSNQNVNDENLQSGSRWSLTSNETNYSESTDNLSRNDFETEVSRESLTEKFIDFNKEMEQLKDDSNNNVITKGEMIKETDSNNIPDLVISCPSDTDSLKQKTYDDREITEPPPNNTNEEKDNENNDVENNKDVVGADIAGNIVVDENNTTVSDTGEETEGFFYHEKKSLYINGSRDELNESNVFTGRVSLYISGSSDDLDRSNNNEICTKYDMKENINNGDDGDDDTTVPIPKQRKK